MWTSTGPASGDGQVQVQESSPPARRASPSRRTLLVCLAVLASFGILLAPSFYASGAELDEGTLLTYPMRVLDGAWPQRDFETFYGPGTPVMLAGAYAVLGPSVGLERTIGMGFKILAILAIFLIVLPEGKAMAALCALITGGILQSDGVVANPMANALALDLFALALLVHARRRSSANRLSLASGLLIGVGVLFRADFAVAAVLGALPLLRGMGGPERRRWLAGVGAGVLAFAVDIAVVGRAKDELLLGDLLRSRAGTRVPMPLLLSANGLLMVLSGVGLLLLATLARPAIARRAPELAATGLSMALFGVALVPYFLERAGLGHIVPLSTVAIGLLPLAVIANGRVLAPTPTGWIARLLAPAAIAIGLSTAVLGGVALAHHETVANLTGRGSIRSKDVRFGDRSFPIDARFAPEIQAILDAVPRYSRPGQRLFVGALDLRQAAYSDSFLYYLLPQLVPASYYLELDPQSANHGTLLASELRQTDILILTSRHDLAHPTGTFVGNTKAPEVVAKLFCVRMRRGTYVILTRCH
jgi:hypothetical protein